MLVFQKMSESLQSYPVWSEPPPQLRLGPNDVHIWRRALDVSTGVVNCLRTALSTDEISRADAFYHEVDRERFIVARTYLRIILSRYVFTDPAEIRFAYSEYGKPFIMAPSKGLEICFNLAHSHGLAVYAVTRNRNVGVDLEMVRREFATTEITERFFSSNEAAHLRSLPTAEQQRAFFTCWTRKEALLKAEGFGLSRPLNQFDVMGDIDKADGSSKRLPKVAGWSLRTIDLNADFVASIALESNDYNLSCWQTPECKNFSRTPTRA